MKNNCFSYKDSSMAFLFAIFVYFALSFVFSQFLVSYSLANNVEVSSLFSQNWVIYINALLGEVGYLIVFLVFSKRKKVNVFACKREDRLRVNTTILTILIASVLFFASINFVLMFENIFSTFSTPPNGRIPLSNIGELLLSILCFALMPAVCEELLFRGIIFKSLNKKFGLVLSVILGSIIFVLIHFSIYQTIYQFLLGIALCLILYFTGNILYCIIAHFTNNLIVLLINYFAKNDTILQFNNWGVKEVILSILFLLIGIAVICFIFSIIRKQKQEYQKLEEDYEQHGQEYIGEEKNINDNNVQNKNGDSLANFAYIATMIFCLIIWITNSFGG